MDVERSLSERDAIEWLKGRVEYETAELATCERKVAAFREKGPGLEPFVRSLQLHADRARLRLSRYQALADIVNDRDEWRTQHENLLAIRQQELRAHLVSAAPIEDGCDGQ